MAAAASIDVPSVSAEPAQPGRSIFRKQGLGYVYEPMDTKGTPYGVRFRIGIVSRRYDSYSGDISVELTESGKHVYHARVVLANTRDREAMVKYLENNPVSRAKAFPWALLVETFCRTVLVKEAEGQPFMKLGGKRVEHAFKTDLIEKLWPATGVTTWYGKQGTGKGWFSIAAALAVMTGKGIGGLRTDGRPREVLYLDWEDSPEWLELRLQAVGAGMGLAPEEVPQIHYRQMFRPLAEDVEELAAYVEEHQVEAVIVDSMNMAMGESDGAMGTAGVKSLYRALRLLNVPVLIIDHIAAQSTDDEEAGKIAGKAFGSSMKMAWARAGWELTKEQAADSDEQLIAFSHTKHNHTRKYRPFAIRLQFEGGDFGPPDAVIFESADLADAEVVSKILSIPERLRAILKRGPSTVPVLAEAIGEPGKKGEDKVRNALNRGKGKWSVTLDDSRWALLSEPGAHQHVRVAQPTNGVVADADVMF